MLAKHMDDRGKGVLTGIEQEVCRLLMVEEFLRDHKVRLFPSPHTRFHSALVLLLRFTPTSHPPPSRPRTRRTSSSGLTRRT